MAVVKIYTRQWCGYCTRAVALLRRKGVLFEEIDTTGNRALREWLANETGSSTVPQIFVDDCHIGDCDGIHALDRAGELDRILQGSSSSGLSTSG
jgi:glutaredoxin 3